MSAFQIFPSIADISKEFKGILLDAYGVFWGGNHCGILPGTKETMEWLVKSEKYVGILSNTTLLSSREIKKFHSHGLKQGTHFHFMTTSGDIARNMFLHGEPPFETPRKKFWLLGGMHPLQFNAHLDIFKDTDYTEAKDLSDADFIFITLPHINGQDQTEPSHFKEQMNQLKNTKIPMICPNPDQYAHEGMPPRPVVRHGIIAKMYEEMGGPVFYLGKPFEKGYLAAMQQFQKQNILSPSEILMVGDTPETDIRGARNFGMASALIIQTGIAAERISKEGLEDVIQGLPAADSPHFLIDRLACHEFCTAS